MAELPPHDADLLFRAAVATELGCRAMTPQVQEIAALLRRLTRLVVRVPRDGAYLVQIAFPGMGREPEIRPYRGYWNDLD
jgi:hypothetical protein